MDDITFPNFSNETDRTCITRRKIVHVSPDFMQIFLTQGWKGDGVECIDGVPETARVVACWFEPHIGNGVISMEFEDDSWGTMYGDEHAQVIRATYRKTIPSESQT